jgi:HSP20 family molecular chaperone IbpA
VRAGNWRFVLLIFPLAFNLSLEIDLAEAKFINGFLTVSINKAEQHQNQQGNKRLKYYG